MDRQDRKAAIAAYKERKPAWGVYAVICTATGEAWVGRSLHVDNHRNGLWFAVRQGSSPHASLQAAWLAHGEREFRFEELERLREDFPEFARLSELKTRQSLWCSRLQASAL
ncbi:GIY-YIG nuclease family protein [Methylobacterium oryzisoli]|uniref:GIY-YIG nuclease family protein n=1 Tax=Methylobacterium oryzisoli TaxID=3385502 RepID=UPI0038929B73